MKKTIKISIMSVMIVMAISILSHVFVVDLPAAPSKQPLPAPIIGMTDHGNEITNTIPGGILSNSNINLHGIDINYAFWAAHNSDGIIPAQLMSITLKRRSHVVLYIGRINHLHLASRGEITTIGVWKNTEINDINYLKRQEQLAHHSHMRVEVTSNIDQIIGTQLVESGIGRIILDLPEGTHIIGPSNDYWFRNANRKILMAMIFDFDIQFTIEPSNVSGQLITGPNIVWWQNPNRWRLDSAPRLPLRSNLNAVIYFTSPTQNFNGIINRHGKYLNDFVISDNYKRTMPDEQTVHDLKWSATVRLVSFAGQGSGIIFYSVDNLDGYRYYFILTNEHVVRGGVLWAEDYRNRSSNTTLIHMKVSYDLAVVRIRRPIYHNLTVIEKENYNLVAEEPLVILSRAGAAAGINFGTMTRIVPPNLGGEVTVPVMASTANSAGGTSGSGVLNSNLRLVGIHYASIPHTGGNHPREALAIPIEQVHIYLNNFVWHLIRG